MEPDTTVPPSREVVTQTIESHRCGLDVPTVQAECPCGKARVIICTHCGEPVFIASVEPQLCFHADALYNCVDSGEVWHFVEPEDFSIANA
jgi:hypothetical protein